MATEPKLINSIAQCKRLLNYFGYEWIEHKNTPETGYYCIQFPMSDDPVEYDDDEWVRALSTNRKEAYNEAVDIAYTFFFQADYCGTDNKVEQDHFDTVVPIYTKRGLYYKIVPLEGDTYANDV